MVTPAFDIHSVTTSPAHTQVLPTWFIPISRSEGQFEALYTKYIGR